MQLVGMISAYKEGRLVRGAIDSLERVGLDHLYVYEGPAGEPLGDDVPESELPNPKPSNEELTVHRGRWRTDARKRNEMLQRVKRDFPADTWTIVLDGDEVLWNAEYLRDLVEAVHAENEHYGRSALTPDNPPVVRIPLRLVERDGTLHAITARVYRVDYVREYNVSSSLVTNVLGIQEGWGNRPEMAPQYIDAWTHTMERGQVATLPPFPCEPAIVHRSHLRHPARRGLRMQDQETRELAAARLSAGYPPEHVKRP